MFPFQSPPRYFFKRDSDEFGDGAVFEEMTGDGLVVPMWQGKIVVKVEKVGEVNICSLYIRN